MSNLDQVHAEYLPHKNNPYHSVKAGFPWTYIENKRHVTKIELALLLVKLLQLRSVVVLALLRHVRSHVSLLFGLQVSKTPHSEQSGYSALSPSAFTL